MLTLVPSIADAESLPITEADLQAWLAAARPGDRLVYHRGFLAVDVSGGIDPSPPPRVRTLRRVAGLALAAVEQGTAHAVQERNGPNDFTYLLIARARTLRRRSLSRPLRSDPALSVPPSPLSGAGGLIHANA